MQPNALSVKQRLFEEKSNIFGSFYTPSCFSAESPEIRWLFNEQYRVTKFCIVKIL